MTTNLWTVPSCGADFIVSNDAHFKCLQNHPFPVVKVISLDEFAAEIKGDKDIALS